MRVEDFSVFIADFLDKDSVGIRSAVRQGAVRAGEIAQMNAVGQSAERRRKIEVAFRQGHTEAGEIRAGVFDADKRHCLDGGNIEREFERLAHGYISVIFILVIFRCISGKAARGVAYDRSGRK